MNTKFQIVKNNNCSIIISNNNFTRKNITKSNKEVFIQRKTRLRKECDTV